MRRTALAVKPQREKAAKPNRNARPLGSARSRERAAEDGDDRRERILRAAIAEFSRNGLAGARTEAIAAGASVNKALLYYYFHSKDALYAAALDASAEQMLESALRSLQHEGSAGERLLDARIPEPHSDQHGRLESPGERAGQYAIDLVADRAALEAKWSAMAAKFPGAVPRPANWGGYVLKPERIEFWQGRPSRLHDRFRYTRQADQSWKLERIAP